MKTVLKTGNRSKVKTGNPKTRMVTGLRLRILGGPNVEPIPPATECLRLLESGDFRLLENSSFRLIEICATPTGNEFDYTLDFTFE